MVESLACVHEALRLRSSRLKIFVKSMMGSLAFCLMGLAHGQQSQTQAENIPEVRSTVVVLGTPAPLT